MTIGDVVRTMITALLMILILAFVDANSVRAASVFTTRKSSDSQPVRTAISNFREPRYRHDFNGITTASTQVAKSPETRDPFLAHLMVLTQVGAGNILKTVGSIAKNATQKTEYLAAFDHYMKNNMHKWEPSRLLENVDAVVREVRSRVRIAERRWKKKRTKLRGITDRHILSNLERVIKNDKNAPEERLVNAIKQAFYDTIQEQAIEKKIIRLRFARDLYELFKEDYAMRSK